MTHARGVFTVLFAVGLAAVLANPALAQRPIPTNVCGDPVFDLDGTPISCGREHLEACLPSSTTDVEASAAGIVRASSGWDKVVWSYPASGQEVGASAIALADVNGELEVILAAKQWQLDYWYSLRWDKDASDYRPVFTSEVLSVPIVGIAVGNVIAGDEPEAVVALSDGRILLYDLVTNTRLGSLDTRLGEARAIQVRDLDGDGRAEILITNTDELGVFSGDGTPLWRLAGAGGDDLVVGQMDDDPSLEVAVTSGTVIDVDSHAAQWKWPPGFGAHVKAADIDGDGMEELVAADRWYIVWSYDVERQLPKWSIPIDLDIGSIWLGDVDGDGHHDLLVGQGQWGELLAFDCTTRHEEWSMVNPDYGSNNLAVGDVDDDGDLEVVWGGGSGYSGPEHIYVADIASQRVEWQPFQLDPPFVGPTFGDVDGDGALELVVATSSAESGDGSGRVLVFDAATLKLRTISATAWSEYQSGYSGIHDLILRNIDNSPEMEILIATDSNEYGSAEIYRFDATSSKVDRIWSNATKPAWSALFSVETVDVDLDGTLEVVAGAGALTTGAEGTYLYVYDLATREEEWHSFQLGDHLSRVTRVAALADGDGHPDILAMVDAGPIYVFDGVTKEPLQIMFGSFTSLAARNGTPRSFLAGDDSGTVTRFEKQLDGYSAVDSRSFGPTRVKGTLELPNGRFAVATADAVAVYASFDGPALWTTTTPAGEFAGGLAVSPLDENLLFYCAPHALLAANPNQPRPRLGGPRVLATP